MNKMIIKGRMARDPELKTTNSGKSVCNFSVAVNRNFDRELVDFFECVAWNKKAEFICKYFIKGKEILIDGEMQSRRYTDKNGNNRIVWELVADDVDFCGNKNQNNNNVQNDNTETISADEIDDIDDLLFE